MQNIENILKTRVENDNAGTFLVIVPTNTVRLKRQRELVRYHPNRAIANLRVYDIENFVQILYNQVRPSKRSISQGLQSLWFHEIANPDPDNRDAYRYESFRPNQDVSVPDSTLSLIIDTINRLRERGETAQSIIDTITRLNARGEVIVDSPTKADLMHIYENYEARLTEHWVDEQGKHLHLANDFDPMFMGNAFPRVNLVVVEGFTVLSKADIEILRGIAQMPNIDLWFRTDCFEENEALYKNITDLVSQFRADHACIETDYERQPDRHQHFAKNLFRTNGVNTTSVPNADTKTQIKVLRPADRSEEVEQIASLIRKQVSEDHCKLRDICVAYYNVGYYLQRIAEIFPTYGIPYSLVEGVPLTRSEVVKAIFSRLSARREPLNDAYFSEVKPASHTRMFHPKGFQEYVEGLLKKGKVIQRVLNPMFRENSEVVEGEIEASRQFNKIVKELCSVLQSEGGRSYSLGDYIEKLYHIARHTNYQNRASTKGETVKIVQLGQLRSLEFDTVFLGDFVEGRFPENYRPDPLLPEIPYRTQAEQLHDNRFMFYRVLKSFHERLYLLIPKREGEADLIPSPFLEQLKAVASVEETDEIADPVQGSISGFLSTYGNHVWTADTPSAGKFPDKLADMHSLIKHVVEVEKSREETHERLAYEGILTAEMLSDNSKERLKRRRNGTYSITELETYAKCPFQYFAGSVLSLSTKDEEMEDELSNLERGSLLHKVLYTFYYNRRKRGDLPIRQCEENEFNEARRQLNEILKNAAEEHRKKRQETPIGENNLFWEMDIEKLRVALHKWMQAEHTYGAPVLPRYFEVGFGPEREQEDSEFGRDPELSCTQPVSIGDVRMIGQIDRIDVGNGAFNIIDYKTGSSTVRMPEILNGRSLQLPIYLQITKKLLDAQSITGLEPAAGLYHKVRTDQFTAELGIGAESQNGVTFEGFKGKEWTKVHPRNGQLLADEIFDARLMRVTSYVQQYVESISKGTFPLITHVDSFVDSEEEGDTPITPSNKTEPCNYCNYKRSCRVGAISESSQSDD